MPIILSLYLCLIAVIIPSAIQDLIRAKKFYNLISKLFLEKSLNTYNLNKAINFTKVKRIYAIKNLTKLYFENINNKENEIEIIHLKELLDDYEREINFPELPKSIMNQIKLIRAENPYEKENILQLANTINDVYSKKEKYKLCNILLSILSAALTLISVWDTLAALFQKYLY